MLERLLALNRPVQLYLADNNIVNIPGIEFQLIERLVRFLKPFFSLTKTMISEVTSLAIVIPSILTLKALITEAEDGRVGTTKRSLLDSIENRFFTIQGV